jgi:hypothetical protein
MTLDKLREQIIALQQELGKAWEAAVDAEDKLEDQGKLCPGAQLGSDQAAWFDQLGTAR